MKGNPAATILRWGLAFVFFYAAVAALLSPSDWVSFLPGPLASASYANLLLSVFSVYELILAVFLFWGKKVYWSSLLATITLAGIVVTNFQTPNIIFRDIGLAMAGLALFEMSRQDKQYDAA